MATDLFARTRGSHFFSASDLQSGFHQLWIRDGDQHKTAFTTPGGQYKWVTCPFGLTNTPSCFQHLINHVLRDHISGNYCVVCCDDVLIFTDTDNPHEHFTNKAVFETLREHQLLIKGSKTELFRPEVGFFCPRTVGPRRSLRCRPLWTSLPQKQSIIFARSCEWLIFFALSFRYIRKWQHL